MNKFAQLSVMLALLVAANQAQASNIASNGSFESPAAANPPGYTVNPTIPNWAYTGSGGSIDYVQLFDSTLPAAAGVTSGSQYLGLDDATAVTQVAQDTGVHWTPNTDYTLTIAMGNRSVSSNVDGGTGIFGLSTSNNVTNFQGTPTTVDTSTIARASWSTFTYTFDTGNSVPAGDIFIIVEKLGATGDTRLQIDNVQLTGVTVPEPSSCLLGGLATIGLVATVRGARRGRS